MVSSKLSVFFSACRWVITSINVFWCLWDSRDDEQHYIIHFVPEVDQKKIYLPPMHIKLGLFKKFVKAIDQDDCSFRYWQQKLSAKSEAKLKTGIFIRPEIRKLINDKLLRKS